MVEFVFDIIFGCNSGGVIIINDDDFVVLGSVYCSIKGSFGVVGKFVEFEYVSGVVLEDGLGFIDGLFVEFDGFFVVVKIYLVIGDVFRVGSFVSVGVFVKFVGSDVVDGEDNFDVVFFGFFY